MNGDTANLAYLNLQKGIPWQFGHTWPGQRCGARTRRGTACLKPALKGKNRCQLHGGRSCGATTEDGLARLKTARTTHGKYTKEERAKAKHRAEIGRRVLAKLRRIEGQLIDADVLTSDK